MAICQLKNICSFIGIVLSVGIFASAVYIGAFHHVHVYESTIPNRTFFYKNYKKAYINLADDIQSNMKFIQSNSMLCNKTEFMGLYYDNPNQIDQDNLPRSTIGFYTTGNISSNTIDEIISQGYIPVKLNSTKAVQTYIQWRYPYSIWVVILKLYNPLLKTLLQRYTNLLGKDIPYVEYVSQGSFIVSYPIGEERSQYILTNVTASKIEPVY